MGGFKETLKNFQIRKGNFKEEMGKKGPQIKKALFPKKGI